MKLIVFLVILSCALATVGNAGSLVYFPRDIDPECRGGRAKIYDECTDQQTLFTQALAEARRQDKVLMVSYGAEWCIWCHVFYDYVSGVSGKFTHTYSDYDDKERFTSTLYERAKHDVTAEAQALGSFVADNFILLHLENRYAQGADAAVASTGYNPADISWLPFVFTVRSNGRFAMMLESKEVETRRDGFFDWFRGYDRKALLGAQTEMRDAAR